MTSPEFKALYGEFASTPDSLVDQVIAEQELLISDSWGANRPRVLALSVADSLVSRPNGRQARIQVESDKVQVSNPYRTQLNELRKAHVWLLNRV